MRKKVAIFDRNLLENILKFISAVATVLSLLFLVDYNNKIHLIGLSIFIILIMLIYFINWIRANKIEKVKIHINDTEVNIFYGDLFAQEGFKVIPFNEYFDTLVDNKVISGNSLNGIYIKKYGPSLFRVGKIVL